jgi:cytochrome-b5 reductase
MSDSTACDHTLTARKRVRTFASESTSGKPSYGTYAAAAAVTALAAGYGYTQWHAGSLAEAEAKTRPDKGKIASKEPKKTFTGGDQGFIDLKLEDVQNINHNVKRFRFELPDKDAVSGLTVACEW